MAQVTINRYIYVNQLTGNQLNPDGRPFVPIGTFEGTFEDSMIYQGASLASTDPACNGVVKGFNYRDKSTIETLVLEVLQP